MQYRPLGKTGLQVSTLAMGCMRLPEGDPELAARVVDAAIAAGVNYFETARWYINGQCQQLTGGGLRGRSRGLIVSGKAGVEYDTTADDFRREMDLQFAALGVDYLEFFQVGWLSLDKLEALTRKGGALEALERARAEGIIGHIGFTGHDTPEHFVTLVETGIFESVTIPYNMVNRDYAPVIARAGALGVGVVAMCPVAGGMLASPAPPLQALFTGQMLSTPAAALRFVLSNPDVSCACSGMNTLPMLAENVATVEAFHGADGAEHARMDRILDDFSALGRQFCTGCGYCMDCPHGVDIPWNFRLYNMARVYGFMAWARHEYAQLEPGKRAEACVACGACEPKCPNRLAIMAQLATVAEALDPA